MSDLSLQTREVDGAITVLSIGGHLDKRTKGQLDQAISGLAERGRLRMVVNCQKLTYLSSDGMGVFLSHLIKIRKAGGDIKFCVMSSESKTVLSLLGLQNLLQVFEAEDEAIEEFRKADAAAETGKKEEGGEGKLSIELIPVEGTDDVSVAVLKGFIDRHTLSILDRNLKQLMDEGRVRMVVDCADLTYISSNGMGTFIAYVNRTRNKGGDIRFCNMRDIARTVITMLGLHNLFQIFDSRDKAIASYQA